MSSTAKDIALQSASLSIGLHCLQLGGLDAVHRFLRAQSREPCGSVKGQKKAGRGQSTCRRRCLPTVEAIAAVQRSHLSTRLQGGRLAALGAVLGDMRQQWTQDQAKEDTVAAKVRWATVRLCSIWFTH